MDGDRTMSKGSVWQEQFRSIGERTSGLVQRSLVDLALCDRHAYWDVEALDDAMQAKGMQTILEELRHPKYQDSISTAVLADALEETAILMQHWNEGSSIQRFLTLWRDRCWQYGWEEARRQAEGILFDYRQPSLQRCNILFDARTGLSLDLNRIGIVATLDGKWLADVLNCEIVVWDPLTGEKVTSWTSSSDITIVEPIREAQFLIANRDGEVHLWEVDTEFQKHILSLHKPVHALTARDGKIAVWVDDELRIWDENGDLKQELAAPASEPPAMAISNDGQRIMYCDGRTIGVWSILTGNVIYGLFAHSGLDDDDLDMTESILDMGQTNKGLRMMDLLQLWGLSLQAQFDILRSLSEPMAISDDDQQIVAGADQDLALLEWDEEDENFVVLSHAKVADLWGVNSMHQLSNDCRYVVATSPQGIVAWDLLRNKEARFPVPMAFSLKIAVLRGTRLIAVDNGQELSIFRFLAD
jgi:hypothetical protein